MTKTFQYNSSVISYTITGAGKPLVLLHGFGEDSQIWDEQVDFLQAYCLLIVPDLPGSGSSEMISENKNKPVSVTDYADCIHALLQEENIACCTMAGHSLGGYITLAFAEKYPTQLDAFGLIHSTAFADSEEKKKTREKGIAFIEEYGAGSFLKTTIPNLFGATFKEAYPEKITSLINASAAFTKEALQQYYRAMMLRPDSTGVLKSNPLPVLFVMGTEDVAAPLEDVLQQTYMPRKSYIHVLPGVGHMGMWEAPGLLNRYILDFMNR